MKHNVLMAKIIETFTMHSLKYTHKLKQANFFLFAMGREDITVMEWLKDEIVVQAQMIHTFHWTFPKCTKGELSTGKV